MHRLWLRTLYTFGCYSMRVAVSISEWMHFKTPTSNKSRGFFFLFSIFFRWKPAVVRLFSTPLQDFLQGVRQSADTENAAQSRFLSRFSRFFQCSSSHCLLKCGLVTALMWPISAEQQHDVTHAALCVRKETGTWGPQMWAYTVSFLSYRAVEVDKCWSGEQWSEEECTVYCDHGSLWSCCFSATDFSLGWQGLLLSCILFVWFPPVPNNDKLWSRVTSRV